MRVCNPSHPYTIILGSWILHFVILNVCEIDAVVSHVGSSSKFWVFSLLFLFGVCSMLWCFGQSAASQPTILAIGNVPHMRVLPILMNEVKIIMDVDHGPYAGEASYTYSLRMRDLTPTYRCKIPHVLKGAAVISLLSSSRNLHGYNVPNTLGFYK